MSEQQNDTFEDVIFEDSVVVIEEEEEPSKPQAKAQPAAPEAPPSSPPPPPQAGVAQPTEMNPDISDMPAGEVTGSTAPPPPSASSEGAATEEPAAQAVEGEIVETSKDLVATEPAVTTGVTRGTGGITNESALAKLKQKRNLDKHNFKSSLVVDEDEDEAEDPYGGKRKMRIGDRLVDLGIITKDQLNVALQQQKATGAMMGQVLVELGFIDEETLTIFLAESSGFEVFDPKGTMIDADALNMVDKKTAMKHSVMLLSVSENEARVAMSDPYDIVALDTLRNIVPKGVHIRPLVTTAKILEDAIDATYGYASSIKDILKELESEDVNADDVASLSEEDLYTHPIVRLVNALVMDAVKIGASDLHFEPEENFVRLRYRVDGVLHTAQMLHKQHWNGIAQRLKIMSEMNIADKLTPQDGRFELDIGGRDVDFRVSSLPTVFGENIVLRVLDQSQSIMPLEALGFSPSNLEKIKRAQGKPEGIIIVTGPTGSGKTTSLYSMINEINDVEVNIQTLEDPVEYSLPMIRQTAIREGVLEFGDGIKALLRQDPDIIFIGEIRDHVTAEMALKAAMTGHQVYTTLHTNDSFGALPRLLDLGLKPGMIAGAIISIFAQRLCRRLCTACKEPYRPDEHECMLLGVDPKRPPEIYRAPNPEENQCHVCGGTGYKGRVATAEILMMDADLDDLLASGASKADIKNKAVEKGFKSMRDDGILKILEGLTSIEAVSKVVDLHH